MEDGLFPNNNSDGTRSYLTPALVGSNFPLFVLKTYMLIALKDPLNTPNLFRFFDAKFLSKKLMVSLLGVFKTSASQAYVSNRVELN